MSLSDHYRVPQRSGDYCDADGEYWPCPTVRESRGWSDKNHPSHPDQIMARALDVCWHSPTSSFWPCTPLADWEVEYAAESRTCDVCLGTGVVRVANRRPYLSWAYREWDEPCSACGVKQDTES